MQEFLEFIYNPFLIAGLSAWLIAQVAKLIIHTIINKKFDISRLFGDGGMPSGHSAMVSSLATFSAITCGITSFEFAVTFSLAIIVCHDATGVRRETGKQAVVLNEVVEAFNLLSSKKLPEVKLKEFVGHTPIQVAFGIMLGVANAFLVNWILPPAI